MEKKGKDNDVSNDDDDKKEDSKKEDNNEEWKNKNDGKNEV